MDLTPIDLKKQEFKRVVRGYDPVEVRRFLDEVADAWEALIRSQEESRSRFAELAETLENYRRMERTLNETLLAAQRIAEESRETSMKEAEILRKEAEMEGRRELDRALAEARTLRDQIRELRIERDSLFTKLRNLMEEELLRLHALRDAHTDVPGARGTEAALAPPERAPRRSVLEPTQAARELLERPAGLGQAGVGAAAKSSTWGSGEERERR